MGPLGAEDSTSFVNALSKAENEGFLRRNVDNQVREKWMKSFQVRKGLLSLPIF